MEQKRFAKESPIAPTSAGFDLYVPKPASETAKRLTQRRPAGLARTKADLTPSPTWSNAPPSVRSLRVALLGVASLHLETDKVVLLERKSAALLAYLALEGPTPRGRIAGLLWPESREGAARNNLCQVLRRLRLSALGKSPVLGLERLIFDTATMIDVVDLLSESASPHHCDAPNYQEGELLAGHNYDDCEEFEFWLECKRRDLNALRRGHYQRLADQCEFQADYRTALAYTRRMLQLDPLDEDAHRRCIRNHLRIGDRSAARAAYETCKMALEHELGLSPMAETLALAEQIAEPAQVSIRPAQGTRLIALPTSVDLHDTSQVLTQIEQAFARQQTVFLAGPKDSGKSRIMREFFSSRSRAWIYEGHPPEQGMPYATVARVLAEMLRAFPTLPIPDWVGEELACLTRGTANASQALSPSRQRLHLFHGLAESVHLAVAAGMHQVGIDDLQYWDTASVKIGLALFTQFRRRRDGLRSIVCFREQQLTTTVLSTIEALVDTQHAVLIRLPPHPTVTPESR